jgi:lipopolysaccharide export system permease protein
MIVTRYLTKEIFATLLATTLMLFLIFISDQLISYLRNAAGGRLMMRDVLLLLSLQTPVLLTMLLPLSLYLSILLAYGRLYVDSEMTVLSACGVSRAKLFSVTFVFALVITFVVAILSLWVAPKMEDYSERIFLANQASALDLLRPGRFSSVLGGKWIFYIEKVQTDHKELQNVFAAEEPSDLKMSGQKPLSVVFAAGGYQKHDANSNFLVLTKGNRYNGLPGRKDYQIVNFREYGVRLNNVKNDRGIRENTLTTRVLWQQRNNPDLAAELHWRFALPIAVFILALLAMPLSRIKPRHGRYAALIPAVLFYVFYANLLFFGRALVGKGGIAMVLGMWWVHIVMLFVAVSLLLQQIGWRRFLWLIKKSKA